MTIRLSDLTAPQRAAVDEMLAPPDLADWKNQPAIAAIATKTENGALWATWDGPPERGSTRHWHQVMDAPFADEDCVPGEQNVMHAVTDDEGNPLGQWNGILAVFQMPPRRRPACEWTAMYIRTRGHIEL